MKYSIAVGRDTIELQENVNNFLSHGWEPQGSLIFDSRTKLYMQPVVRDLDDGAEEN